MPEKLRPEPDDGANGGIGVAPAPTVAGVMGMVMMVMMMPGFGRGFGDAPADQKSCGESS